MFGIKPVKPLKSLLIQAENDFGDVSEMLRGPFWRVGNKNAAGGNLGPSRPLCDRR